MSWFVGHPVAAKPDWVRSRSVRAGTLYNLQPAEALYFNQQQRGSWGVGVEFISIYLSIRYVKGGVGGLIQISYNAAKLNYSHEMDFTKHFLKC